MSRIEKVTLICDRCGKKEDSHKASGWMFGVLVPLSYKSYSKDLCGYCSKEFLLLTEKQRKELVKWLGDNEDQS